MTTRLPLLAVLLLAASALAGQRIAKQGDDWVLIFDSPCVSMETIARIPEAEREGWSKAQGFFQGQRFFGCWRAFGAAVYILWDDGDQGIVPIEELKPVNEARSAARHTA